MTAVEVEHRHRAVVGIGHEGGACGRVDRNVVWIAAHRNRLNDRGLGGIDDRDRGAASLRYVEEMARRIDTHLAWFAADFDCPRDCSGAGVDHRDRIVRRVRNEGLAGRRVDLNTLRALPTGIVPVIDPVAMSTTDTEFPIVT